jgi:prepilin-type processing-associated H-X9-DG protein
MFVPRKDAKFRDVLDGLANTIMCGEIKTDIGDRDAATDVLQVGPLVLRTNPVACRPDLDPERPQFWDPMPTVGTDIGGAEGNRGYKWACGFNIFTGFQTILPPNDEICVHQTGSGMGGIDYEGIWTASSRHQGGAHILMGDGAVIFITDSIEAGDSNNGTVRRGGSATPEPSFPTVPGSKSPYGLWGALGTRAASETIEEQLNQ